MSDSVFNPHDAEDIRQELTRAILARWSVPSIEGTDGTYYKSANESEFRINTFESEYIVTIKKVP